MPAQSPSQTSNPAWRFNFTSSKLMGVSKDDLIFAHSRIIAAFVWRAKGQKQYALSMQLLAAEAPCLTLEERRFISLHRACP